MKRDVGRSANFFLTNAEYCIKDFHLDGLRLDATQNIYDSSASYIVKDWKEAYYTDYRGCAQELISAAKHGFLYQGQWCSWQEKRRGSPVLDIPPQAFVHFIQNHDQIANSATGQRIH